VSKASERIDEHVFRPDLEGARDWHQEQEPIDCLICPFPRANEVHISHEDLVAGLPPVPDGDRSAQIIGEGGGAA